MSWSVINCRVALLVISIQDKSWSYVIGWYRAQVFIIFHEQRSINVVGRHDPCLVLYERRCSVTWSNGSSAPNERYHPSPSIIIHVELTWFVNCKRWQYPVGVFRGNLLPPVACAWAMVGVDTHDQNQHPYSSLVDEDQLSSYIRSLPKMVTLHRPCASVRTQYRLA